MLLLEFSHNSTVPSFSCFIFISHSIFYSAYLCLPYFSDKVGTQRLTPISSVSPSSSSLPPLSVFVASSRSKFHSRYVQHHPPPLQISQQTISSPPPSCYSSFSSSWALSSCYLFLLRHSLNTRIPSAPFRSTVFSER